ncbi:Lpp/OprI family alanine-zipper lipoprotein [Pseudomonas sp. ABY48]|uniref:Lpp/OprI family alanine-zipper lipoprotein n=1 Tax=Pseudomonas sp. ABY48 TaxID=3402865 RepID=UPI003B427DAB
MNRYLSLALLSLFLATSGGCSHKLAQEVEARLDSAENNAATARLRADEAYRKAEQAEIMAEQAQRTAEEASIRATRMTDKATRK